MDTSVEETQTGKLAKVAQSRRKMQKLQIQTLFVLSAEISLKPVRTYLLLLNIYLERFIFSAREDSWCSVLAAHKLQMK